MKRYRQIDVYRMSGGPVSIESSKKFQEEWQIGYDVILKRNQSGLKDDKDNAMKLIQTDCEKLEKSLLEKYPTSEQWDWVDTQKEWKELTRLYGPIAILSNSETNRLSYVILDQLGAES